MSPDRIRALASARREALAPGVLRVAGAVRRAASAAHSTARRRPDAVLAAVLLVGVLVMVLHWKGAPVEQRVRREVAQRQAAAQQQAAVQPQAALQPQPAARPQAALP